MEPSEGSGVHLANVLMAEEGIHIYLWCHFYSLHIHSALFLGSSSSSSSSSASVSFLCCVVCAQHSYYMWLPHCMSSFLSYVPLFHIYHPLPPATTLDKYLATYPLWFHSHCYDMLLMLRRIPWFRLLLTLFQQAVLPHPSTASEDEENVIISKIIMIGEGAHSPLATASIGTRRQTVATSADHEQEMMVVVDPNSHQVKNKLSWHGWTPFTLAGMDVE